MLTSIHIQGFKNFKDTQITPLRKVNLILGGQNVGKTSLLEAVYLGTSPAGNAQRLPSAFRSVEGHDIQRFLAMTFKAQVGGGHIGLEVDLGDGLHGESLTGIDRDFRKLVIDNERVRSTLLMFRLAESVNAIVVHESVRKAIELAKIEGMVFYEPGEWSG